MKEQIKKNPGLKGKRIIVMGGTSGFGLATAQAAANEGAHVVVVSSKKENVDRALDTLPQGSDGFVADVSDERQVIGLFEKSGTFDHLVFTAGETLMISELDSVDIEKAKEFFNIRFWGGFMAAKYGSKFINTGGSIVLTNGIVGLRPWKGWSVAASMSGATESLTRALAIELAPIRVNTVCAGMVKTSLWNNIAEADRETMFREVGVKLPVGRVGEADDIAETYLYLMKQPFCTGQVMVVDGGATIV